MYPTLMILFVYTIHMFNHQRISSSKEMTRINDVRKFKMTVRRKTITDAFNRIRLHGAASVIQNYARQTILREFILI